MEDRKYQELKRAIERRSKSLKNPPKNNQTNRTQMQKETEGMRKEREHIMKEYLMKEGYADNEYSAEKISEVMSAKWRKSINELF
jgi:hypothetical protein